METTTPPADTLYTIYGGTKNYLQITSVISVVNFKYRFTLTKNTFQYNSGTKGVVYLDFKPRTIW